MHLIDTVGVLNESFSVLSLFRQIECCETADEFYGTMGRLTQEMLENDLLESHELMQVSGQHGLCWLGEPWVLWEQQCWSRGLGKCTGQPADLVYHLTTSLYIMG